MYIFRVVYNKNESNRLILIANERHTLNVKQWFVEPTPKQFFYISLIYAVVFPVIGVFVADPMASAFMLFFLVISALVTRGYLKPSISSKGYNVIPRIIPLILIIGFIASCMTSGIFFTKIIEDKASLERVNGTIPNEKFNYRVGKHTSSSLLIRGTRLHCRYHDRDNCSKAYDYSGQTADVLYQSGTWVGNVVYEINIDGKKVYRYEDQLAYFKQEQRTSRRQWFLTFMLFGIPSYWFYKHDKRLRKATPKISIEKEQMLKESQESVANEAGCAGAIGVLLFLAVAIGTVLTGIIQFAIHQFGLSLLCFGLTGMCWYAMVILSKPSSEL